MFMGVCCVIHTFSSKVIVSDVQRFDDERNYSLKNLLTLALTLTSNFMLIKINPLKK